MKRHETCFSVLIAVSLFASACNEGGDTAALFTPSPLVETATQRTVETPLPPTASASSDDLIEAAVAQLNSEIAAGEGPSETFAYDLLSTTIDDAGFVTLTICAWTGDTVFDTVRDSLYRTAIAANGSITATHVTTPVATGDCVNTQLIESAFDFINEFDKYWADVSADPTSFTRDPRTSQLLTDSYETRAGELTARFVNDDLYFEPSFIAKDLRTDSAANVLFRLYRFEELQILEIVACRPMNPVHGAYRDSTLIDAGRSESSPGLHAIHAYQLVLDSDALGRWKLSGTDALGWADCFETGEWPAAANQWRPRNIALQVLNR
jgi:hypothetical protein